MSASIAPRISPPPQVVQFKRFRWWYLLPGAIAAAVVFYAVVLTLNWPFTRPALIETLHERSLRQVTIERFHKTYFPPGCVAEGIRFLRIKHPEKPALLTIQKLMIEDSYPALLSLQRRLAKVTVIGLHLVAPAKEPAGEPSPVMPLTYTGARNPMTIGVIFADGAVLDFLSQTPGKQPFRLIVKKLALYDVEREKPSFYRTEIHNTDPPGEISSSGAWGPWNPMHPDTTPVHGEYAYQNANLAALPELSGMLNSSGHFNGTLGHIEVHGTASVANFQLKDTSHRRQLSTEFEAVVDATKGDVFLNRVLAQFNRTALLFKGSVAGKRGEEGKTIALTVSSSRARLEDLLELFISADRPSMSGNVNLQARVNVPPGAEPFLERVNLHGGFGVGAGLFRDPQTERELAKLSVSAIKGEKEEDREDPRTVLSDITGQVDATHGTARLSHLSFRVPGAQAVLDGTFSLTNYRSDMHGVLITNGEISDATSGLKSLFLKALTPFFKRKEHARVVPFKISGPYGKTTLSLDLTSKKR